MRLLINTHSFWRYSSYLKSVVIMESADFILSTMDVSPRNTRLVCLGFHRHNPRLVSKSQKDL
jgi:hypothetical protein